ncbi:hybrid sensor histidine kinase/response regulator [Corallococcus sp. H22C18031201]|nr:hybrid sensor histidine kinase/response regulator [Corallococcus sp. H22C18031201]
MNPSERLLKQFRELVTVRLERINRSLVELEGGANLDAGRRVLRELHGLKGEARMMGFDDINALVHQMEELVRRTEPSRYLLTADSTDALLTAADAVLALSAAAPASAPSTETSALIQALETRLREEAERLPPPGDARVGAPALESSRPLPARADASLTSGGRPASSPPSGPAHLLTTAAAPGAGRTGESPHASGGSLMGGFAPPGAGRTGESPHASGGSLMGGFGPRGAEPARAPHSGATDVSGSPSATRSADPPRGVSGVVPAAAAALTRLPAAPGTGATRTPEPRVDPTSVRIDVASLDLLTNSVTNLTQVARRRDLANARRLELAQELGQLAREAEDLGPAAAALVARLGKAKALAATLHREAKLLSNAELRDLGQVAEEVQTLRMLPLSVLFEPYPRRVRDLARELGKEVELVVDGEDTRADRAVVEALRDPLMHLVRNALDHGLETRVDRVTGGKKPRGCLTLRAAREGNRIVLRVEDDGVGLEPAELRRVAVRKGFLDEAAAHALSDAAARDLIFLAGFTSRDVVTDLSGRGVGLDAVRTAIQGLGGDAGVESAPGWGTIFTLRVPVSLTVAPLLFIQVADEVLALSATHVSRALRVEADDVGELAGRPTLKVAGGVLPFAPISALLGLAPERPAREGERVLVVRSQGVQAALGVDKVLEERVQAILPLKGLLARFAHLSGATTLADGRLSMVLSAAFLTAVAHGTSPHRVARAAPRAPSPRRRRILVVDDSPLTRELLSNLLEAVGYDTRVAADGAEALALLGQESVDLVLTDLEMPGVDGLELTRQLKGHFLHARLPVVILTTRGGEEDRMRGLAAGADGYITKGDLVRQDLVDVVGRLLS